MASRKRLFFYFAVGLGTVWSYSRRAIRRWEYVDLAAATKPGRLVEVDGVNLHYVEAGSGPPLLLLHGLNGSTFSFRLLMPLLTPHFRTVALDLMGFGYSDRPQERDYSLGAQARLVAGFLDALDIDRASVLGHSLGGAIAMRLALDFPERVDRLILASSASDSEMRRCLRSSRLVRPLLPVVAAFTVQNQRFRRMSLRSSCYDPAFVTPEMIEGYLAPTRVKGHLRALGSLMVDRRKDPPLDLSTISQPALIIWGAADRWLPASHAERIRALIPDSRVALIQNAGHLVLEEQPEDAAREIIDFLREAMPRDGHKDIDVLASKG
ncbi:MAG: alpha/beta fold hydrolase [Acidobacteria bacterium]|nr:alpha/beta fold hydrolase [Acidobacteriota bacterium]